MDDVDRTLVATLLANARTSYAELGRLVGMTPPSVQDRVRRLEASGALTGYHAAVDPVAVGLGVTALVGIQQSDAAEQDEVLERLRDVREVEDCWFVAGDESFLLKLRVGDIDALEHVLGVLRRIPGVARTRTTVVLSTKWEGRLPFGGPTPR